MSQYRERDGNGTIYVRESGAGDKYSDLCKPLYKEIGNVVTGRLDDKVERIHREGGGEKGEEGSRVDDGGSNDDVGEGEER